MSGRDATIPAGIETNYLSGWLSRNDSRGELRWAVPRGGAWYAGPVSNRALRVGLLFLASAAGITLVVRRVLVLVEVQGDSMCPTLTNGDLALAVRTGTWLTHRGTIVVAHSPDWRESADTGRLDECGQVITPWVVKRVAALSGDPIPNVSLPDASLPRTPEPTGMIPFDRCYLLGDAAACVDSRLWGPVPKSLILGPVILHWHGLPSRVPGGR